LNALMTADFSTRAASITSPVLVICSQDDLLVPWSCSVQLAAALPDSQLVEMPWGGHAMSVTDPEPFNALLMQWLNDTDTVLKTAHVAG